MTTRARRSESLPPLDAFDVWVDEMHPKLGNSGKLLEAVRYAHDQQAFAGLRALGRGDP